MVDKEGEGPTQKSKHVETATSNVSVASFHTMDTHRDGSEDGRSSEELSFVDYTGPAQVKVMPPAKYKLWLNVFLLVYLIMILTKEARFLNFLRFGGTFHHDTALFLNFAIVVFVLAYAGLDLLVQVGTIEIHGVEYGMRPWLKAPRVQWVHRYNNVFVDCLYVGIKIMEEGFGMFRPLEQQKNNPTSSATNRKNNNDNTQKDNDKDDSEKNHGSSSSRRLRVSDQDEFDLDTVFTADSHTCKAVLKIEHHINPLKMNQYQRWRERLTANKVSGLVNVRRTGRLEGGENSHFLDPPQQHQKEKDVEMGGNRRSNKEGMKGKEARVEDSTKEKPENFHYTIYLTFKNVDYLNDWMCSPRRKAFIIALQPLLMEPDVYQIQQNRVLPDAFTDLLQRTGEAVPQKPPKKWKVWWLTTLALFITIRWSQSWFPYYMTQWGLDTQHLYIQVLVEAAVYTWLNSYIFVPLFLFLFSGWTHHGADEPEETREPWITLNKGIQQTWLRVLLVLVFYGGNIVAWILRVHYYG